MSATDPEAPFCDRVAALPHLGAGISTEFGAGNTGLDPLALRERRLVTPATANSAKAPGAGNVAPMTWLPSPNMRFTTPQTCSPSSTVSCEMMTRYPSARPWGISSGVTYHAALEVVKSVFR